MQSFEGVQLSFVMADEVLRMVGEHARSGGLASIEKVEEWRTEYNEVRPHSAIGDRTPLSLIHPPRQHVEAPTRPEILSVNRSNFWDAPNRTSDSNNRCIKVGGQGQYR